MEIGLHALGIGSGARRAVIDAVAGAAEAGGFATLWCGEHVVMVDRASSRYPYAADGRIAVPADADWLDPLIGLSFAAAATRTIGIATGVLLVPEHNPVLLAKQAASLDALSGGRLTLGVGVGWSREEFEALGVPFARRGARAAEYVAAMRRIWSDDVASFAGEHVRSPTSACTRSPRASGGSRWCSAGTATRRSGAPPRGATAGTASTSTASPRRASGSRRCTRSVARRVATPRSCGPPSR